MRFPLGIVIAGGYCHRESRRRPPSPVGPAVDPVADHFHERQNARGGQDVDFIERKRERRRGIRRRDPQPLEGTVDPGGLDVPAPPRARSRLGRVKVGFCFLPALPAPASDKRAALAYERAVPRPDGDGPCRARLTALTVLTFAGARIDATPASNGDPAGRSR